MHRPSILLMTLILGGCATLRPGPPAVPLPSDRPRASSDCPDPLGFYETASLLAGQERLKRKQSLARRLRLTRSPCDTLQLALLLGTPLGSLEDKRRAVKLLERYLQTPDLTSDQARLARLLRDQLQQQIWALGRTSKLKQKLKEREAENAQLDQRIRHLESLLEQLKDIERNFNEQEQAIIAPSTPAAPR